MIYDELYTFEKFQNNKKICQNIVAGHYGLWGQNKFKNKIILGRKEG